MAFRFTRSVLNEASKYESPHRYHYVEGRTPFWRKFRSLFVVNPEISSGLPLPTENRNPTPGSRPEKQNVAPSKASDIAGNLYYNRDFRRKYPKLEILDQSDLTKLLLASPNEDGTKSLYPPGSSNSTALTVPSDLSSPEAFTQVLAQTHPSDKPVYNKDNLPPLPPFARPQHVLKIQKGAVPHDPHAYYPAENYA